MTADILPFAHKRPERDMEASRAILNRIIIPQAPDKPMHVLPYHYFVQETRQNYQAMVNMVMSQQQVIQALVDRVGELEKR